MLFDLFSLKGKNALITGSSRGLGFNIARGLAMAGAKIILNGRNQENLDRTVSELKNEGFEVFGSVFDVTEKKQINIQIASIEQKIGPIDILFNNAGIQRRKSLQELDEKDWQAVIDTNLTGAFLTSQQVVTSMIRRKKGKIINTCSLMSELGRESVGAYSASKGGLKMLTKNMATEWAKYNIQVNGIGPGYFATEMTRPLREDQEFDHWLKKRTPANRWGNPEELIGTAVFLASSASDFVNGQIIYVDGGVLAAI